MKEIILTVLSGLVMAFCLFYAGWIDHTFRRGMKYYHIHQAICIVLAALSATYFFGHIF